MIDVRNINFAYGERSVLENISFQAQSGEVMAVLGANGAGKSTLMRCILGLLNVESGEIFINERNIKGMSRRDIASLVAYIPQAELPVYNYTVFDTVLMGTTGTLSPLNTPGSEQLDAATNALKLLGISDLAERGINEISGGERQLAFLARAIAQHSPVLIMDEPTANLDYGNQQLVLSSIRSLAEEGYTIMLSTHNPEHALHNADTVLVLKDKNVFAYGSTLEVMSEKLIYDVYGIRVATAEVEIEGNIVRSFVPVGF